MLRSRRRISLFKNLAVILASIASLGGILAYVETGREYHLFFTLLWAGLAVVNYRMKI